MVLSRCSGVGVNRGVAAMLSVAVDSLGRSTQSVALLREGSSVIVSGRVFRSSGLAFTILSSGAVMHRYVFAAIPNLVIRGVTVVGADADVAGLVGGGGGGGGG